MKKVIFVVVKKIVLAICLVYAFNLLASGLKVFIPINVVKDNEQKVYKL